MNTQNIKGEVKRLKLRHVVIACAAVLIAFGVLGSMLFALGGGWTRGIHFGGYSNGIFGVGKTTDVDETQALDLSGITAVKISGVADQILMQQGEGSAHLKSTCTSTGDPVKLKVEKSGSTLNVQVFYPPFCNISNRDSVLTVTLPAEYAGALQFNSVSGDVQAQNMPQKLTDVNAVTVSGLISFSSASQQQLHFSTTSGDIQVTGITGDFKANTVSGSIKADIAAAVSTDVGTTSGDVTLSYAVAPGPIQANTVSGAVGIAMPANASCQLHYSTVSGQMRSSHSELPVEHTERGFDARLGDGAQPLRITTVSGGLTLTQN